MDKSFIGQLSTALNAYAPIPEAELVKLIAVMDRLVVKKDDYFIKAGGIHPWLGYITSGIFRCYNIDAAGTEYTKHFFAENDFMVSCDQPLDVKEFSSKESEFYFQAMEDSVVLKIDRAESMRLLTHPCWQKAFAQGRRRIFEIEERRIRQLLFADAETRYLNFMKDFPGGENRIKQFYIASYIGISPESLSRIRTKIREN